MKKIFSTICALTALSAICATPSLADGFEAGGFGEMGGSFEVGSMAGTMGGTWKSGGQTLQQNSMSHTETGAYGDLVLGGSTEEGVTASFSGEAFGLATNSNTIKTKNGGSTGSWSGSYVSGGMEAGAGFHVEAGSN